MELRCLLLPDLLSCYLFSLTVHSTKDLLTKNIHEKMVMKCQEIRGLGSIGLQFSKTGSQIDFQNPFMSFKFGNGLFLKNRKQKRSRQKKICNKYQANIYENCRKLFKMYQRNRGFSSNGKNVSTRDNTGTRILNSGFYVVDYIESPSRVSVWGCILLTLYGAIVV